MYHEDAKLIMDSIHADTEKMIREITEKYGNLDELPLPPVPWQPQQPEAGAKPPASAKLQNKRVEQLKYTAQKGDKNEHGFLSEDEMSSDSLEDCSLNAESEEGDVAQRRKVCKKHSREASVAKTSSPRPQIPDVSSVGGRSRMYDRSRNVSLSEILMDDKEIIKERQRRTDDGLVPSAGGDPKSEESFLSDDFSNENLSYYNSMESIMSDESAECKSAPLDVIFNGNSHRHNRGKGLEVPPEDALLSKSYGSSPNNCPGLDYYYMQSAYSMANRITMTQSNTCPTLAVDEDGIPSSQARMDQYRAAMNKSLREDFGAQRAAKQSENPLWGPCEEVPVRFKREDIFGKLSSGDGGRETSSFGPDLVNDCESRTTEQSFRKFEKNLQKFERDRSIFNGNGGMPMDYVPHKPPMAGRRSTSMRARTRKSLSGKFSTMGNIEQFLEVHEEAEGKKRPKGDSESEQGLIGLELNFNEPLNNVVYVDLPKEDNSCDVLTKGIELPRNDYAKFNDIRHKIEIVQKLVEMEERKLEEAQRRKECRMKPFEANVKEKGYVKSLTMNFDNLAKGAAEEGEDSEGGGGGSTYTVPRELRVKRIKSVPELESVKFRSFHVLMPDEGPSANCLPNRFYNDLSNSNKNNTNEQKQMEMNQGWTGMRLCECAL